MSMHLECQRSRRQIRKLKFKCLFRRRLIVETSGRSGAIRNSNCHRPHGDENGVNRHRMGQFDGRGRKEVN